MCTMRCDRYTKVSVRDPMPHLRVLLRVARLPVACVAASSRSGLSGRGCGGCRRTIPAVLLVTRLAWEGVGDGGKNGKRERRE